MSPTDVTLRQIDVPPCETGATEPIVLSDEHKLVFGYYLPQHQEDDFALFRVNGCLIFKFGYPNDEALPGHRYASAGLSHYSAYEVVGSDWIDEISRANARRFPNSPHLFRSMKHFIFTFHDTTLEFVCDGDPQPTAGIGPLAEAAIAEFRRE